MTLKSLFVAAAASAAFAITAAPQPTRAGTPDAVAACTTSPTAPAFAACVGGALTMEEATKCFASGFKDCYGPTNDLRKFVDRNIAGPLNDIARGEIGGSDKSVWHQIGLPRIKLW